MNGPASPLSSPSFHCVSYSHPVGPVSGSGLLSLAFRILTLPHFGLLCPTRHAGCHPSNPSVLSGFTLECQSLDRRGPCTPACRALQKHLLGKTTETPLCLSALSLAILPCLSFPGHGGGGVFYTDSIPFYKIAAGRPSCQQSSSLLDAHASSGSQRPLPVRGLVAAGRVGLALASLELSQSGALPGVVWGAEGHRPDIVSPA